MLSEMDPTRSYVKRQDVNLGSSDDPIYAQKQSEQENFRKYTQVTNEIRQIYELEDKMSPEQSKKRESSKRGSMFTKQSPFKEDNPGFRAFKGESPHHNNLSLSENDEVQATQDHPIESYVPKRNRDTEPSNALWALNVNKQGW